MDGGSSASYLARTPCNPLSCTLIGVETEGLLDYQKGAGIISIVWWNLRPVIFGIDKNFCSNGSTFRVVETVVLENGRFVPCREQVVLTKNGENSDIAFCPPKQGILLLGPRKWTKPTKMTGVTPAK